MLLTCPHRQKRLAEWKAAQSKNVFGEVVEISGQDYVKEVNKAGDGIWVVLHLYKPGYVRNMKHSRQKLVKTTLFKQITCSCPHQHPVVRPDKPAPVRTGQKVPADQVSQVHLHHLHPQLPRPQPAHHLCLLRGRHEGPVHRPARLWRHES